jgi:hypothetical protein
MESIKKYTKKLLEKIELIAFTVPQPQPQSQNQVAQSPDPFDELINYPTLTLPFLKFEYKMGLLFNFIIFLVFLLYLPVNALHCLRCDRYLTIWLSLLGFFNTVGMIPKALALWKLNKMNENEDRAILTRVLWLFIRCKVSKLNEQLSTLIFILYVYGAFRLWQIKEFPLCYVSLWEISFTLVVSFFSRLLISFIRFNFNFCLNVLERDEGLDKKDMEKLKSLELNDKFMERFNGQDTCSICYDAFSAGQSVRVMNCGGLHIYHIKCIDQWLALKKTCPNCNTLAMGK